ncbi:hypothetical protein [Azospirillum argentinense]
MSGAFRHEGGAARSAWRGCGLRRPLVGLGGRRLAAGPRKRIQVWAQRMARHLAARRLFDLDHPLRGAFPPLRNGLAANLESATQLRRTTHCRYRLRESMVFHSPNVSDAYLDWQAGNVSDTCIEFRKRCFQIQALPRAGSPATMDLPKSLREARKAKKLTQAKVAADLGVSRPAVGQWESGETTPEPKNLLGLARLYGLEFEALASLLPGGEAAVFRAYSARNHAKVESAPDLTNEEWGLVLIYRQLPPEDKDWLWTQIHREARRAGISLDDAEPQPE